MLAGLGVAFALCRTEVSSPLSAAEGAAVSLPVTVTDSSGRPVRGLTQQDFIVTEDGTPQTISTFADKDIPLSLALIVDTSPGMRGPWLNDAFFAIRQLVTDAVGAQDEVSMWVFGRRPLELQAWAAKDVMLAARYKIPDAGDAPFFETISLVSKNMEKAKHVRRVVIGVTGGVASDAWRRDAGPAFAPPAGRTDPPSQTQAMANAWSPSQERERALKDLKAQNFALYTIGLAQPPPPPEQRGQPAPPMDMNEMRVTSESTGGYVDLVKSTADLTRALTKVREELQSQYLISYVSPKGQDGKVHDVKVSVTSPDHKVRVRQSYTAKKR